MRFSDVRLRIYLFLTGVILTGGSVSGGPPELPREQYLARGCFQLAVFNRDETRLLTTTGEIAQLWDLRTGTVIQQFEGHEATIHSVCFSRDEQQVLTGAGRTGLFGVGDYTVRLWDAVTGKPVAVFGHPLPDEENGPSISGAMISARFSPDEKQVLGVSWSQSGTPSGAILWNRETKQIDLVVSGISTFSNVTHSREPVHFSPDGRVLAGLFAEGLQVRVWDARTGEVRWQATCPEHQLKGEQERGFGSVQLSPSGKSLLAACSDKTVRIWDVDTGREMQAISGHTDEVWVARFSPNGKHVITASQDRTVRLWDSQSGRQLQQWVHPGPVQEMSVSLDGRRVVTRWIQMDAPDQRYRWFARLWDATTGNSIHQSELPPLWLDPPLHAYRSSIFSPTGGTVLTTVRSNQGAGLVLLDAETGAVRKRFE